jgi:hypothetical protein
MNPAKARISRSLWGIGHFAAPKNPNVFPRTASCPCILEAARLSLKLADQDRAEICGKGSASSCVSEVLLSTLDAYPGSNENFVLVMSIVWLMRLSGQPHQRVDRET